MTTAVLPGQSTGEPVQSAWLTRLRLNPAHRQVQRDLGNAVALHRRVMTLVPDGLGSSPRARAGVLFRLETDGAGAPALLVQSRIAPDTGRLPRGYAGVQTRDMNALFAALRPGVYVRYRLLGNAVRRCGRNSTEGRWKQAIVLRGEEADRWWAERAAVAGLALHTVQSDGTDSLTAWHDRQQKQDGATSVARDAKHRQGEDRVMVNHQATRFEGLATVRDADALRATLLHGVGRSKSYGCGLLSLAPGGRDR
ncbi:type I-E CRISPR-associated protein Cas6/Cse3/CasE [Streptomyces cyaneofuscatus]|uniref:type I-E CRISPR-associated protein Cas6/Cse3/CasE n=1 Tax=Streptomyces cyaneofuscatus TaxID=66883 RepID=UPI0033E9CA1D